MLHQRQSLPQVLRCGQRVKKLVLDDSVHPLRHTVVRRIAVLGHTDADMVRFEARNVLITTVLHPAVGMMDCAAQVAAAGIPNSLLQSLNGVFCLQSGREDKTDYHPRESICNKVQITEFVICGVNIGYIAHPQLIDIRNREVLYKVWIREIDMI